MSISSWHNYNSGIATQPTASEMHARIRLTSDNYLTAVRLQSSTRNDYHLIAHGLNGAYQSFRAEIQDAGVYVRAEWTSAASLNQWYSVCGVFRSGSNRQVYVDGAAGLLSTGQDPKFFNEILVYGGGAVGISCDHSIWNNTELSSADRHALSIGVSPLKVKPNNLTYYWDTRRGDGSSLPELTGSLAAAPGTPSWRENPPVINNAEQTMVSVPTAAGGATYTLTADAGSLNFAGTDSGLEFNRQLVADAGAFTFTGTDAALEFNRQLIADAGSFNFTGTDATLTYTPAGSYELVADAGAFSFTGVNASLEYNRVLQADAGSLTFTGTDADLNYGYILIAEPGALSFTGTDAALIRDFALNVDAGAFTFTGTAASLAYTGDSGAGVFCDYLTFLSDQDVIARGALADSSDIWTVILENEYVVTTALEDSKDYLVSLASC